MRTPTRQRGPWAWTWALALLPALLLGAACRDAGDECTKNRQCGEGICLKGVCSGYACAADEDCPGAQVCAVIGGNDVCALPCAGDGPCPGAQSCRAPSDDPEGQEFCL
jgi:hypothetical protein